MSGFFSEPSDWKGQRCRLQPYIPLGLELLAGCGFGCKDEVNWIEGKKSSHVKDYPWFSDYPQSYIYVLAGCKSPIPTNKVVPTSQAAWTCLVITGWCKVSDGLQKFRCDIIHSNLKKLTLFRRVWAHVCSFYVVKIQIDQPNDGWNGLLNFNFSLWGGSKTWQISMNQWDLLG